MPLAAPVQFSSGAVGRDPSVTWNPITNEFGVALSGETYSALVVVPAWNVGAFRRNTFNIAGGILTTMTDVSFNPFTARYVMAWYELSSANYARIAEFDIGGNLLTTGVASTRLGSYNAFSMAFNQQTATFLLVGLDRVADTGPGARAQRPRVPLQRGKHAVGCEAVALSPRICEPGVQVMERHVQWAELRRPLEPDRYLVRLGRRARRRFCGAGRSRTHAHTYTCTPTGGKPRLSRVPRRCPVGCASTEAGFLLILRSRAALRHRRRGAVRAMSQACIV